MSVHDEPNGIDDELPELDAGVRALLADRTLWDGPSFGLDDRIVAAIESEAIIGPATPQPRRGRRTWVRPALLGAAAAVVLLFVGLVALSAFTGVERQQPLALELVPTGLIDGVGGDVDITESESGLRLDLAAPGLPRRDGGRHYAGWLAVDDGTVIPVGTFHDGAAVTLWAGVELARVRSFTITMEDPARGDDIGQASSGRVVLKTNLQP